MFLCTTHFFMFTNRSLVRGLKSNAKPVVKKVGIKIPGHLDHNSFR
jgi:hypothetical protein